MWTLVKAEASAIGLYCRVLKDWHQSSDLWVCSVQISSIQHSHHQAVWFNRNPFSLQMPIGLRLLLHQSHMLYAHTLKDIFVKRHIINVMRKLMRMALNSSYSRTKPTRMARSI